MHDGSGELSNSVRMNPDNNLDIAMEVHDPAYSRMFARTMPELEAFLHAPALSCTARSPWDRLGLKPYFDGVGYVHIQSRMYCFTQLSAVVRRIGNNLFGAGDAKHATHARKVTLMGMLTSFVIGQLSIAFARLDLSLLHIGA